MRPRDPRLRDLRRGDLRRGDLRRGDLRPRDLRRGDLRPGDLRPPPPKSINEFGMPKSKSIEQCELDEQECSLLPFFSRVFDRGLLLPWAEIFFFSRLLTEVNWRMKLKWHMRVQYATERVPSALKGATPIRVHVTNKNHPPLPDDTEQFCTES